LKGPKRTNVLVYLIKDYDQPGISGQDRKKNIAGK
jgi:hypothetical protein